MGISYEPSLLQQLGGPQALDQLGEGIAHLVNPDYKFQQAMRAAIATNPHLAQELADQEYSAPGTLKNMGLGPLGETIAKLPESPDAATLRTHREQILGIKGGQVEADVAKTATEKNIATKTAEVTTPGAKGFDPQVLEDAVRKGLKLPTGAEQRTQEAEAQQKEYETAVQKLVPPQLAADAQLGKLHNEILQAGLARRDLEAASNDPTLNNINLMQVVKDARRGKFTPQYRELFATPQGQAALKFAESAQSSQDILDERLEAIRLNNQARSDRTKERSEDKALEAARTQYLKTGAGSLQAWLTVQSDPNAVKKAQDKLASGATLNQDELDLVEVGKHQAEQVEGAKADLLNKQLKSAGATKDDMTVQLKALRSMIDGGPNTPPSQESIIQGEVGSYNQKLAVRNKQTGRALIAKYGPVPEVGSNVEPKSAHTLPIIGGVGKPKKDLYYTENGKRVPDSDAANYIQSDVVNPGQTGSRQKLSDTEQKMLDAWNQLSLPDKARLRNNAANDDTFKSLLAKGLIK